MGFFIVDDSTKEAFLLDEGDAIIPAHIEAEHIQVAITEKRLPELFAKIWEVEYVETEIDPEPFIKKNDLDGLMLAEQEAMKTAKVQTRVSGYLYTWGQRALTKLSAWIENRDRANLHVVDDCQDEDLFSIGVKITGTEYDDRSTEDFNSIAEWAAANTDTKESDIALPRAQALAQGLKSALTETTGKQKALLEKTIQMLEKNPISMGTRTFGRQGTDWRAD